jgi:hypothetical protein
MLNPPRQAAEKPSGADELIPQMEAALAKEIEDGN